MVWYYFFAAVCECVSVTLVHVSVYVSAHVCGTDLSRPGLIFSKLRERREAQGVELAELPREPGPGPGTPPHISPLRTSDINTSAVTIMSTSTSQSSEVVLICLIKESEKNVIKNSIES